MKASLYGAAQTGRGDLGISRPDVQPQDAAALVVEPQVYGSASTPLLRLLPLLCHELLVQEFVHDIGDAASENAGDSRQVCAGDWLAFADQLEHDRAIYFTDARRCCCPDGLR